MEEEAGGVEADEGPTVNFLSICSGIEAASVAWKPLGWRAVGFSEIEPFPCAVLAHHYPDVPNFGDMTKFEEWRMHEPVDLVCGGTPCQAFSVAGLREGLADPRGNLSLTFLAIVARHRPRWVVFENVPGITSSLSHDAPDPRPPEIDVDLVEDGTEVDVEDEYTAQELHAFNCFLAGLAELGYGWAYRILDAQYFGVPQRRRRVFVVGHLGDWRPAAAVLFERESLCGHPPPGREVRKGFADGVEFGPQGGGFTDINPTLDARAKDGPIRNQLAGAVLEVSAAVTSKWSKGSGGPAGDEAQNLVPMIGKSEGVEFQGLEVSRGQRSEVRDQEEIQTTHTLRGDGFDASEDGTGRGTPIVPIAFNHQSGGSQCMISPQVDSANALQRCQTQAVAFAQNQVGEVRTGDVLNTLNTNSNAIGRNMPMIATVQTPDTLGVGANQTTGFKTEVASVGMQVRRLTPRECDRLQGFPDDYTRIPWRKSAAEDCPDGPRYKALGNSWAVPVARWVGRRIALVDELLKSSAVPMDGKNE